MKRCGVVGALLLMLCTVARASDNASWDIPFFDGVKLQSTYIKPKLTNANHLIGDVNPLTGTKLDAWNSKWIQSVDLVLWRDLSPHFKMDVCVGYASGTLASSSDAFGGTRAQMHVRMTQLYTCWQLWSNLYYYPWGTGFRTQPSGKLFEPFVGIGLGYSLFRSKSVFKLTKPGVLKNRIRVHWWGNALAYKLQTGLTINPGRIAPQLKRWVINLTGFYVWNRMTGNSTAHYTEGLEVCGRPVGIDARSPMRMDIDISGYYLSLAIGRYF